MAKLTRNVAEIVDEVVLLKDLHQNERLKLMSHAFAFIRELALFNGDNGVPTVVKELFLRVPPSRVLPFPEDFVDFIQMSTQVGDVKKPISQNTVLSSFPVVEPVRENPNPYYWVQEWEHNQPTLSWMASFAGKDLGFGNNRNYGEFTINYTLKRFEFSPNFLKTYQSVILDYWSDCLESSDKLCLAPQWQTPLQHFILWKYHSMRGEIGLSQEQERIYGDEMRKSRQTLYLKPADMLRLVEQTFGYRAT